MRYLKRHGSLGEKLDLRDKYRKLFQIVHQQEKGFFSLDFMFFDIHRDSYGFDNLKLDSRGYSLRKAESDRINWKRADEINFFYKKSNRHYGQFEYNNIHKSMENLVRKRWQAKIDS